MSMKYLVMMFMLLLGCGSDQMPTSTRVVGPPTQPTPPAPPMPPAPPTPPTPPVTPAPPPPAPGRDTICKRSVQCKTDPSMEECRMQLDKIVGAVDCDLRPIGRLCKDVLCAEFPQCLQRGFRLFCKPSVSGQLAYCQRSVQCNNDATLQQCMTRMDVITKNRKCDFEAIAKRCVGYLCVNMPQCLNKAIRLHCKPKKSGDDDDNGIL